MEEHAASTFSVAVSKLSNGVSYTLKVQEQVMAHICAGLPDRNRIRQERYMSTIPALALEHVLNIVMIKTTTIRHVRHA